MFKYSRVLIKFSECKLITKRMIWSSKRVEHFALTFGLERSISHKYRSSNGIKDITMEDLNYLVQFCEKLGISRKEILRYPQLLKNPVSATEKFYKSYVEGGFTKITGQLLTSYGKVTHRTVFHLKGLGFIPKETNVAKSFQAYLKEVPKFDVSDLTDDHSFQNILHTLLVRYLMLRLETTEDEMIRLFRMYKLSLIRSFEYLNETLKILESLGYSKEKILKNAYILTSSPQNTKAVVARFPTLGGVDIRRLLFHHPKLFEVRLEKLLETSRNLKAFGFTDEQILKEPYIFNLSPETVKIRLEELNGVPELRVLLRHPDALSLVIYHNRIRSRLSFLKNMDVRCTPLTVLIDDIHDFEDHVRSNRDRNNITGVVECIGNLLETDRVQLQKNLKKHPFSVYVPYTQIHDTFHYLKEHFSVECIEQLPQIMLYPVEKIKKAIRSIRNGALRDARLSQMQILNLILYSIEKDFHFTGNGVWDHDSEDLR